MQYVGFHLFDRRVVPHFCSLFVEVSNPFYKVDLVSFTAVGLQMICMSKCKHYFYIIRNTTL